MQRFDLQGLRALFTTLLTLILSVCSVVLLPPWLLQWGLNALGVSTTYSQAFLWCLLGTIALVWGVAQVVTLNIKKVRIDETTEAVMAFPVISPEAKKYLAHCWPFSRMLKDAPSQEEVQALAKREEAALQRLMRRQEALKKLKALEAQHPSSTDHSENRPQSPRSQAPLQGHQSPLHASTGASPSVDWQRWQKEPLPKKSATNTSSQNGFPNSLSAFTEWLSHYTRVSFWQALWGKVPSALLLAIACVLSFFVIYHEWFTYAWEQWLRWCHVIV
jgi:hypothetical protein